MSRLSALSVAGALLVAAICHAAPPPAPAPLPGVELPDVLAVAETWQAQSGPSAEVLQVGGHAVLKLTCNFAGTEIPRGCWDRSVELDLTDATAICFDVYVDNLRALRDVNLYLGAAGGWYGARWYPEEEARWCRIRLPLAEFYVDRPGGGWGAVDTIRFSPWAGLREDAVIYVANFGLEHTPSRAALVLGEYEDRDGRPVDAANYTNPVAQMLDDAGCPLPALSSKRLGPDALAGLHVLVLPYASGMPAEQAAPIAEFVRSGGKLIAMYGVPGELAELLGVAQQGWRSAQPKGEFASMRFAGEPPPGAPAQVAQLSWGLIEASAAEGTGEVAAWWHDDGGARTDVPAIITSDAGAWFSHILLTDDSAAKGRLLVALLERFAPGTAGNVAQRRLAVMGQRLQEQDWDAALALTRGQPAFGERARAAVGRATTLRADAQAAVADAPFDAMSLADEAEAALEEAFCLAQESAVGEFRATWCHPPEGIAGWGWPKTAAMLADAGIDHLILNALHGASAGYPSAVVPFDRSNVAERDYLQEAVDACAERGIGVHVWMTNFKAGGHTPDDLMQQFRDEGRLVVRDDGTVLESLCPSDPRNQQLQIDAMIEAAQRPGVAGIHFDYIRYPDYRTCFCDGCRARFEEANGQAIVNWPGDAQAEGPLREQWLEFRRANITRVVREVSEAVRTVAPGCMISAAVFRGYPACADDVGQDWVAWANAGYLDFVCPMNYTHSNTQFRQLTEAELQHLDGRVPCYPGIGLLKGLGPVGATRQVQIARELGTGGFVIWSVYPQYADVYPYLGMSLLAD